MTTTTIPGTEAMADDGVAMRQAMVSSQLRTSGVDDVRIVTAMGIVPRERFVPSSARAMAYIDRAVPLGGGRHLNPPLATGRLLVAAELLRDDRVLLVGAATGYTAALLAQVGARVVALESDPALAAIARERLADTPAVFVAEGPLADGCPADAPFDVLCVDGAIESLPEPLVRQLRPGGRIVTGLVERGVTRLAAGRRTEHGHGVLPFLDAECVLLPGFSTPPTFRF